MRFFMIGCSKLKSLTKKFIIADPLANTIILSDVWRFLFLKSAEISQQMFDIVLFYSQKRS